MEIVFSIIIAAGALVSITAAISGLPGSFILWLVIFIIGLIEGFETLGPGWIAGFFAAAVFSEIFEYMSSLLGIRYMGGSSASMKGALLGGVTGALIFSALIPLWGLPAGVLIGTFTGAFLGEYKKNRNFYKSSRAGSGALAGRVISAGFKVLVILTMAFWAIVLKIGLL